MTLFQKLRPVTNATEEVEHDPIAGCVDIADAPMRIPTSVHGVIRSIRIQPQAGVATVQARIDDGSGELIITFLGRRRVGGIEIGRSLVASGVIGNGLLGRQMLNPVYRLLP
jgi:hypothetical protein